LLNIKYLAEIFRVVVDETQSVFCERVKNIQTVDLVTLGDGEVEADQGEEIRLGDAEGNVQAGDEVGHLVEADELGGVWVEPRIMFLYWTKMVRFFYP